MAEAFLSLSAEDRRDALEAASRIGLARLPALLEKDVWVVWTLQALFDSPFADDLAFKGGTSLSKAYHAIDRFSEDVDLTYDIRKLTKPQDNAGEPSELTRSKAKSLSGKIEADLLPEFLDQVVTPHLQATLRAEGLTAELNREGTDLLLTYEAVTDYPEYVKPRIKLEFGARSTGDPAEPRPVVCDLAEAFPELGFPTAFPRVLTAERTFWEKATAAHVFCKQCRFRGAIGFARHWHDLVRLDDFGLADAAIADRVLAKAVADYKTKFFPENVEGVAIDYHHAVGGALVLVPEGEAYTRLEADYLAMVDAGLLGETAETFADLMVRATALQVKANVLA